MGKKAKKTKMARQLEDKADRPVFVDGLEVGKVIFHPGATEAVEAATSAAFDISSTKYVQFCVFSDGSYGVQDGQGGVSVVHRRQWLPSGWGSDQTGTHPNGDFNKQAWSYKPSIDSNAMEAVGLLESCHAANKAITRDLQALKNHDCKVTVKCTTDSTEVLRRIADLKSKPLRGLPTKLIDRIKQEIQMLHGHGIEVLVELHWCPRNQVPQPHTADELAGIAMATGRGYTNNTDEVVWRKSIKSDMTLEINELLFVEPSPPEKAPTTSDQPTAPPEGPKEKGRRARKRERRRAQRAEEAVPTWADDADANPQLPLPPMPPLTERDQNAQEANSTRADTLPRARKPAAAEAVKRKFDDEEDTQKPNKKAKLSHGKEEETSDTAGETDSEALTETTYTCTMPARGGMDPEIREGLDEQCPLARMVVLAAMDWKHQRKMSRSTML